MALVFDQDDEGDGHVAKAQERQADIGAGPCRGMLRNGMANKN
jgi:hypothetical protein